MIVDQYETRKFKEPMFGKSCLAFGQANSENFSNNYTLPKIICYCEVTPFGTLLWQAEADTELPQSASPTTAVGQKG